MTSPRISVPALYDRNREQRVTHQMGVSPGPRCGRCERTEADCAYYYGACCADCDHWRQFTADGQIIQGRVAHRIQIEHGTEAGYREHLRLHRAPCLHCRVAHYRHKKWIA